MRIFRAHWTDLSDDKKTLFLGADEEFTEARIDDLLFAEDGELYLLAGVPKQKGEEDDVYKVAVYAFFGVSTELLHVAMQAVQEMGSCEKAHRIADILIGRYVSHLPGCEEAAKIFSTMDKWYS